MSEPTSARSVPGRAAARPVIAVTVGEPAGIGPEIALRAAWALRQRVNCVLLGDAAFLALTASLIDPAMQLAALSLQALRHGGLPHFGPGRLAVVDVPLAAHVVPGVLDKENGRAVLATLDAAVEGVAAGRFDAIVTAPLQKSTINDAGVAFSGHTEYLAGQTNTAQVVMMLAGEPGGGAAPLRVALATTHLPLAGVAAAITPAGLATTLDIIDADLRRKFGIAAPRILVAGLNPHAGEGGYLGREEIDTIAPAIAAARARGIDARGPYPADTLFQPKYLCEADCVLAMYHDQGLPVLKYATFGHGVNITLGLPLIRTSVDHGTALDLAAQGLGLADCGSMEAAIDTAVHMVRASRNNGAG
ncbi:4-hydroxythreonine-4-phosphate dehydrogenase PdxA [Janthinobacterium fluminis]|uniref:4-hydroxythreonine-4-phosphate dehydrogenase n=1 Tax=Janthinobacterium fluminis TaxID=2987524 RepID=A0ABT5K3C6_9BURK|nr:4-hydroxythreonine-4-phosphate dehydrogenase PdxA [Janthinobacterium fluminis]MDC8759487.1 4-hydroxythreonine-4-phosphate dehydrogenase PdxA [Janthinobacterium fluminis]